MEKAMKIENGETKYPCGRLVEWKKGTELF